MSAKNDESGGAVGIRMVDLESNQDPTDADHQLKGKKAKQSSYMNILTDRYDSKETWWDAVEDLLKKDTDFAQKVSRSSAFHRS